MGRLMWSLPELLYSSLEKLEAICSAHVLEAMASTHLPTTFSSSARGRRPHCQGTPQIGTQGCLSSNHRSFRDNQRHSTAGQHWLNFAANSNDSAPPVLLGLNVRNTLQSQVDSDKYNLAPKLEEKDRGGREARQQSRRHEAKSHLMECKCSSSNVNGDITGNVPEYPTKRKQQLHC
ncbi:hypothetical protein Cgig2_009302 [Carnegiea gigantea]|uniref:Uncharacterized protein n=1 Tax=Carnegiea gigantea TaxID=171969 RepID=A0A9Q1Q868_9CARY|nr:hypothetical protein Cgig2_009302 [Carnegiea gigantea]